jgi:hypothetical protein
VASHGGGTIAVESQSSAASAILAGETNVAGIGGVGAGDTRDGSARAFAAAEKVARKLTVTEHGTKVTLYDLQGRAAAILAQADATSSSRRG